MRRCLVGMPLWVVAVFTLQLRASKVSSFSPALFPGSNVAVPSFPGSLSWRLRSPCQPRSSSSSSWSLFADFSDDSIAESNKTVPPFPSKDENVTALDYFNHPYFFGTDFYRTAFVQGVVVDEEKKKLLTVSLDDFFQTARGKEKKPGIESFLRDNIFGSLYPPVLEAYMKWKEENDIVNEDNANLPRMVNVDFQIQDSNLSHTYDIECFSERIEDLFRWHVNTTERESYVAPYFCFVQSSGMGKTKIMYEYKRKTLKDGNVTCVMIIPPDMNTLQDDKIFYKLDLIKIPPVTASFSNNDASKTKQEDYLVTSRAVAEGIFLELDDILNGLLRGKENNDASVSEKEVPKIALLFDESQGLLKNEFGLEAFRFRCVRLWLREIRNNCHVVAVFAGTSSRFSNFLFETDEQLKNFVYPSRVSPEKERNYHEKGRRLYLPYFRTTTIGACLRYLEEAEEKNGATFSEYERSVYYGRPLFALMAKESKLDESLGMVLRKMLCLSLADNGNWKDSRVASISLLSTRIQMGQVTAELASSLVGYGYANFCGFYPDSRAVIIGHFPDPVCARLAMCMMDETFEQQVTSSTIFKGLSKKDWTGKFREIFSTGIVSPAKGDFGEVVVALHMLFCGDLLRGRINEEKKLNGLHLYSQFSVSLDAWLQLMKAGGRETETLNGECQVSVGFIQVCRNSLRSYRTSWTSLADQSFLKHIYELGIAFYVFPGCPIIDMVVPLRVRGGSKQNETKYIPMFVSIKCMQKLSDQTMASDCRDMKTMAVSCGLPKAFCLLISFGSDEADPDEVKEGQEEEAKVEPNADPKDYELKEGERISQLLVDGGVVARTLRIPFNDVFGLTDAFKQMTPAAEIASELFSSHSYLMAHGSSATEDLNVTSALRQSSPEEYVNDYTLLRKAMTERRG